MKQIGLQIAFSMGQESNYNNEIKNMKITIDESFGSENNKKRSRIGRGISFHRFQGNLPS